MQEDAITPKLTGIESRELITRLVLAIQLLPLSFMAM
jgi:hypothetical protein